MAEYKRKKIHTSRRRHSKLKEQPREINIPMRRSRRAKPDITQDSSIRVVPGKKGEKRKRFYIFSAVLAGIVSVLLILSLILPVGLIESAKTLILSMSSGSYPIDLSGGALLDCAAEDNHYFVLTDTSIMAFSRGGKKIFSVVHGFSSPIITTSPTRALIYDQGGNEAVIYNLSGLVSKIESKEEIICADVSRNGEYALVTRADSYASCVNVYNKSGEKLYTMNLAKDMINSIDIAPSGKKIALSTLSTESGKAVSSFRIYDFNSADPVYKFDLGEDMVYTVKSSSRGFFVATHNKLRFVHKSKFTVSEFDCDGEISSVRYSGSGMLVLYNKTNDKSNNTILLFSGSGKKISEFDIKHAVSDIRFVGGRVYSMGDSVVSVYDKHGDMLGSNQCGFGGNRLYVTSANSVCVITDSEIEKTNIK